LSPCTSSINSILTVDFLDNDAIDYLPFSLTTNNCYGFFSSKEKTSSAKDSLIYIFLSFSSFYPLLVSTYFPLIDSVCLAGNFSKSCPPPPPPPPLIDDYLGGDLKEVYFFTVVPPI
jgi:hypothetical protein